MIFHLTNGDRPPTGPGELIAPISPRAARRLIQWGLVVLGIILLFVFLSQARGFYTDWLWFDSLGFRSVFSTILVLKIWLFFAGAAFFFPLILANVYIAYRIARGESVLPVPQDIYKLISIGAIAAVVATVVIMTVVFGAIASSRWETFLIFFNKVSFGVTDPQFDKDVSFYVAVLPLLHFIQGWLMGAIIATIVAVIALYVLIFSMRGIKFDLTPRIRGHLAILGALLMVSIAAAHFLDRYETLFSGSGASYGASYVDAHARITALWIITGIALLSAVGFLVSIYFGGLRTMIASFGLWVLFALTVGVVYPLVVQRFSVDPDEFNKEEEFIGRNLEATRAAYDLEDVIETPFLYEPGLTAKDVIENPQTIDNVRLWDRVPLMAAYNQIQFFELYYDFVGVDVDRYNFDGDVRQVMLAARELSPEDLPEEAQRWVNQKLEYTHGYGVAMSPVTTHTQEGKPEFLLQDIPPVGLLDLEFPQIYYGENTSNFVIVKTKTKEIDFPGPGGEAPFRNTYEGAGGVGVGSFFRKLAYAWEFLDFNLLISNQLTSDSKVLYRRTIQERVGEVVPFLRLDSDPYLVVADGRLWWIQDAYTTTDRYPYSTPTQEEFNYIRNSVKVVVDAYNGTMKFYIVDPDDPMVRIYQRAFPDLFEPIIDPQQPFLAIPPDLREHVRYPLDLFSIQARRYLQYHMRDPEVFFNREDQWDFGNELFFDQPQEVRPYYVIMKLPGEAKEEFVQIMPFTPFNKPNMVAWMAARNDGPHYGELRTFTFPTGGEDISGPEQVEARITNDQDIRKDLTLLCPQERVICIRGNLLVIPVGETVLYVEPLFIRPIELDFPTLEKVFVADGTSVVMSDSLREGIDLLLARTTGTLVVGGEPTVPRPGADVSPETLQQIQQLFDDFIRSQRESLTQLEEELEGVVEAVEGSVE